MSTQMMTKSSNILKNSLTIGEEDIARAKHLNLGELNVKSYENDNIFNHPTDDLSRRKAQRLKNIRQIGDSITYNVCSIQSINQSVI
jgi:hypothetical protein